MNDKDDYQLEVVLRFAVPVSSTLPMDPHEMAVHMRETWINEEASLKNLLLDAMDEDFDLEVRPTFIRL